MAGFSFSTSGSTPKADPFALAPSNPTNPFATSQSKALNAFGNLGPVNFTPNAAQMASAKQAQAAPAPSTPVKKTTVNNVDGSSHTTEYHAPTPPTPGLISGGYAQTDPSRVINNTTGQTAGGGFINGGNTGGSTPSGATVDANGNVISPPTNQPTVTGGLVTSAANAAQNNTALGQNAQNIGNKYAGLISDVGAKTAGAVAGDLSTGTTVVGSGNAAIASQSGSARMNALANAENAELAGNAQALTGANQLQSGLLSAANISSQTTQAPYGTPIYNPTSGEFINSTTGAGMDFNDAMEQYAQMAAKGQVANIPSSITSNSVLNAQLNKRAKEINSNYNPITSAAQGASAADLTTQASQIQANANGAEANFKLLVDTASKGGVNNNTVPALNALQNNVSRGLTSSEAVTLFRNTLSTVRNQYATILGGGTATDQSRQTASDQIPDDISLSALQALETQLQSESQNRITGINEQIKQLTGGGGTGGSSYNTNSGASSDSVGWY